MSIHGFIPRAAGPRDVRRLGESRAPEVSPEALQRLLDETLVSQNPGLSWTRGGKHHTPFVRREDVPEIRRQLRAYERQRERVETGTDLARELCQAKISARRK